MRRHDPIECPNCIKVTKGGAIAIRYCATAKAESDRVLAAARAANPDVDAIHTLLERARA